MKNTICQKLLLSISCCAGVLLSLRFNLLGIIVSVLIFGFALFCIFSNKCVFCTQPSKGTFVLSAVVFIITGVGFYEQLHYSSALHSIFAKFHIDLEVALPLLTILCIAIALPFFARFFDMVYRYAIARTKENHPEDFEQLKKLKTDLLSFKRTFIVLFILILVALSAIIRADYFFRDDLARVVLGYKGWDDFGRFGSNALSSVIHAGTYLTDVSPLPQIISAAILAVSAILLVYVFKNTDRLRKTDIAAAIPMILSPFVLQCVSYKYDSPYMALAIFFGILPFLFWNNCQALFFAVSVISTVSMCLFYQSASGIYIVLAILLLLREWNVKENGLKPLFKKTGVSVLGYALGIIVFKVFLLPMASSSYRETATLPLNNLLSGMFNNVVAYYKTVLHCLKLEWTLIIAAIFILFPLYMAKKSKQNKLLSFGLSSVLLVLASFMSYGVYLILEDPSFEFRSLIGFGVLTSAVLLMNSDFEKKFNCSSLAALALSVMLFSFSFTYGNALNAHSKYVDEKFTKLSQDICEIEGIDNYSNIAICFDGEIGSAKSLKNMPSNYQNLRNMIINDRWEHLKFIHYYGFDNMSLCEKQDLPENLLFETVNDNLWYTIKVCDNYILVTVKP